MTMYAFVSTFFKVLEHELKNLQICSCNFINKIKTRLYIYQNNFLYHYIVSFSTEKLLNLFFFNFYRIEFFRPNEFGHVQHSEFD